MREPTEYSRPKSGDLSPGASHRQVSKDRLPVPLSVAPPQELPLLTALIQLRIPFPASLSLPVAHPDFAILGRIQVPCD